MVYALRLFLISFSVFMVVDLIWLGFVARKLYAFYMQPLLRDAPYWPAAWLFYVCYVIGLIVFVIHPAIQVQSVVKACVMGALFGFFTYMTYELTCWAVLKQWPAMIVWIDILWGMVLCSAVCGLTTFLYLSFFNVTR